jgi:hypothetical protein
VGNAEITYYQRSDVAWTPITDIPPSEVRLAWVATRRTPLSQNSSSSPRLQ